MVEEKPKMDPKAKAVVVLFLLLIIGVIIGVGLAVGLAKLIAATTPLPAAITAWVAVLGLRPRPCIL